MNQNQNVVKFPEVLQHNAELQVAAYPDTAIAIYADEYCPDNILQIVDLQDSQYQPGNYFAEPESRQNLYLVQEPGLFENNILTKDVIAAPDMPGDELIRRKAAKIIAAAILPNEISVEKVPVVGQPTNLMEAIHQAASGDETAGRMVAINCETDILERVFKSGIITRVELEEDENGNPLQFGQTLEAVNENTLRHAGAHPIMLERAKIEAVNGQRIQDHNRLGTLDSHVMVVFSAVPTNMSAEEAKKQGYFETMSVAIQATTRKDQKIEIESAFVAGCDQPGGQRFDIDAICSVASWLGEDFSGLTPEEILARPLFIPKELMKDGIVDLVKKYDDHQGTFFGQKIPRQDYKKYLEECDEKIEGVKNVADRVKRRLVTEATQINSPILAVKRLAEISQEESLNEAIVNHNIDPRVYGTEAVAHIELARLHFQQGNWQMFEQSRSKAQKTAVSSSCPNAMKQNNDSDIPNQLGELRSSESSEKCIEIKDGQSVKCPECKKTVRAIVPNKEEIYCSNGDCKLAHPKTKKLTAKIQKVTSIINK